MATHVDQSRHDTRKIYNVISKRMLAPPSTIVKPQNDHYLFYRRLAREKNSLKDSLFFRQT